MGRELQRMGLNIKELNVAQQYTDEILEGIDIVVAILRFNALFKEEQQALVRYVRNGGSLLVLAKYTETLGTMAPVIVNFGLVIEDIFIDRDFLNDISFPCTTDDIPVENCRIFFPRKVTVKGKAKAIAGYVDPNDPNSDDFPIFAIGGNVGRGRVIAGGNANQWLTLAPFCGLPLWGKADNTALLHNIMRYLAGASDLKLVKFKAKSKFRVGKKGTFRLTIRNEDVHYSRPTDIAVYLSEDGKLDMKKDIELAYATIGELKGIGQTQLKLTVDAMPGEPGKHTLFAVINPAGSPLELNENNNVISRKTTIK